MAVPYSCMSWTPANSTGTRAAHPSRICVLSEHRESTVLSRSYRVGSYLVGEDSPGSVRLFSRREIPLSPFFRNFARRLRKDRRDAYSAQFWCNLSPLDATLLSPTYVLQIKNLRNI